MSGNICRFSLNLCWRATGREINTADAGSGMPCSNQRATSAQHFVVGMRCDDRDPFALGVAHFERLERLVETHGREDLGAILQIDERLPIAHEEFVGLPRINGALEALQHRAENVRHVIALAVS